MVHQSAIPSELSNATSAMASHEGLLCPVHIGDSSNDIWHSVWDRTSWSPTVRVNPTGAVGVSELRPFGSRRSYNNGFWIFRGRDSCSTQLLAPKYGVLSWLQSPTALSVAIVNVGLRRLLAC